MTKNRLGASLKKKKNNTLDHNVNEIKKKQYF